MRKARFGLEELSMSTDGDSSVSRVRSSFQHLSSRASDLNALSDQVGKVVARFDAEFNKLNIGISGWVRFQEWTSEDGLEFTHEEVGYARVGNKWGLAVRTMSGNEAADNYTDYQEWLFNDAPRLLRLKAIDKIPELFEKLVLEVDKATKAVDDKLKELQELATALDPVPLRNSVEFFSQIKTRAVDGQVPLNSAVNAPLGVLPPKGLKKG
jgi:hypothetical protein